MLWLLPLLLPPASPGSAALGQGAEQGSVTRRLGAMGTWLELTVRAADRARALRASEAAVRALEACEARLSTWREDSELARLNRSTVGAEVTLSEALASDLAEAQRYWRATDGAFDPGLGALVAAWGLRQGGRAPSEAERREALAAGGFAGFELDGRRAVRRHPRAAIEEGGFGKGLGLDAALRALTAAGAEAAVLDLGGQLLVHGEALVARLADPRARERAVLELTLASGSLSTSGNSERGIVVDGVRRGHLLDPRTGEPAPDFGSLTVWAPSATAADCLSTGLYVLGPEGAFRWRAAHAAERGAEPAIELLVLVHEADRLRAFASAGWRDRLAGLVPELELVVVPEGSLPSLPLSSASTDR